MRRLIRGLIIKALITALLPSFALLPNRAVRPQKTVDIPLLEAAVRIARSHQSQSYFLSEIAVRYAVVGHNKSAAEVLAAAFDIARNAPVNDFQPITMWNVAVTLARADEYSKAIEVATEIKSPFHQALALAEIGVFQARVGSTPHEQLYGPWREPDSTDR